MFIDKVKKLFIGGEWSVVYKRKDDASFSTIVLPKGLWAADPMLFEHRGTHYLFAEIYESKKRKASIGYFEFIDGVPIYKGMIIENEFHMSYPCVFEFGGSIYMIPESSANASLELYEAKEFPARWERKATILDNCSLVDTTVYLHDEDIYLLSYRRTRDAWELVLFSYDISKNLLVERSKITYSTNVGRPAGYLFRRDGRLIRPAQDSSRKYGERLLMNELKSFDPLSESTVGEMSVSEIPLSHKAQRVHTYSEDSKFVVLDVFTERFEPFHAVDIYMRSHFKKLKK